MMKITAVVNQTYGSHQRKTFFFYFSLAETMDKSQCELDWWTLVSFTLQLDVMSGVEWNNVKKCYSNFNLSFSQYEHKVV